MSVTPIPKALWVLALTWASFSSQAVPVRDIPGLTSITFYEPTGGSSPSPFTFARDGPELTTRLTDPLGAANNDISGASTEFYDVYFSDDDGTSNLHGEFVTISGVFLFALPFGAVSISPRCS